jgi:hypothetical protein
MATVKPRAKATPKIPDGAAKSLINPAAPPIDSKLYFIVEDETAKVHSKYQSKSRALEVANELVLDRAYSVVESKDGKTPDGKVVLFLEADPDLVKQRRESRGPRQPRWGPETKFRLLVTENPKKAGARVRFESYFKSKTLGEALALGLTMADWYYDLKHNLVEVAQ